MRIALHGLNIKSERGVGIENLLVISFGTGIGAGLILGGSIFRGSYGLAGEVGHMTLKKMDALARAGIRLLGTIFVRG